MEIILSQSDQLDRQQDLIALDTIAELLEDCPRTGEAQDIPEGSRYILISDTFATQLAVKIRAALARIAVQTR